jgi:hypothetical protein
MLNELSNTEAFLYARQCRVVVAKLRLCWNDINEEIKSLLKHKEYTEAAIDHIRKDLIINKESVNLRKKPKREAVFCFFVSLTNSLIFINRNLMVLMIYLLQKNII